LPQARTDKPMRAALILLVVSGCGTTTVTRSLLAPLPPVPFAQVAPSDWNSTWVGTQVSPAHEQRAGSKTGVQVPAAQPELGTMFMVANHHFIIGASLHGSTSSWARPSAPNQVTISDQLLFGARVRVGFRLGSETGFGVLGSFEPGFDFLPFAVAGFRNASLTWLPEFGGSVAAVYETGRFRIFGGLSATTVPRMAATVTVAGGCLFCATEGLGYSGIIAFVGGLKVNVSDSFALSASLTAPLTYEDDPRYLPMFAVTLVYQTARKLPPVPTEEPEDPPPGPDAPPPPLPTDLLPQPLTPDVPPPPMVPAPPPEPGPAPL
jgi:hypothetical protein